MRTMYDSTGLASNPPNVDATAFYIGGEDPYRVWPRAEIDRIGTRYRLPIWVNSKPVSDAAKGTADGNAASQICRDLGQPEGTCIALDLEMARAPVYAEAFDKAVQSHGYLCIGYGSESTITANGKLSGGFWVAYWDGHPDLPTGGQNWAAKQYANDQMTGKPWDLSVVADSVPLWDMEAVNMKPSDVWDYEINVPDYAKQDHPGVTQIPAGGYLRGIEHLLHVLIAKVDAVTSVVEQIATLSKNDPS